MDKDYGLMVEVERERERDCSNSHPQLLILAIHDVIWGDRWLGKKIGKFYNIKKRKLITINCSDAVQLMELT